MNEPYIPDLGLLYPDKPDAHFIECKIVEPFVVDETYPFLEKKLLCRLWSTLTYACIFTLVFFIAPIKYGLKIEGRENLRKHKKLLKNGALTVSNHVYRWDFLGVLQAVRYRRLWFPAWKENFGTKDKNLIRLVGGIPIPDTIKAMGKFNEAFDTLHKKKKWIHVFPESSNWPYYVPIRPFKKGAFTIAQRYNLPVIPMAFSYRKPKGLLKLFLKEKPAITLRVGEPLVMDSSLSRKEAVLSMRKLCHQKVLELAGITNNIWPSEGD